MRSRNGAALATAALLAAVVLVPALPAAAEHAEHDHDHAPSTAAAATVLASEDFDSLLPVLQPRVDETHIPETQLGWTPQAPAGWTVTNDDSMSGRGMAEWRGWTFTTPSFWVATAPGQGREAFTRASGVMAVADNDEWDDGNRPGEQLFTSVLTSPSIDVAGGSTVHVNFDSSYRQTGPQVAALEVSFDGGEPERLFEYSTSALGDQVYLENRLLTQPIAVPADAGSMRLSWVVEKATNDWYWAVDDITVTDAPAEGAESPLPPPPLGPGDVPDGISDRKVLFIDFDGVRLDEMREARTPHLDALAAAGQLGVSYMQDNALGATVSGHGHANLLSGVWADKHGSLDNSFTQPNIEAYPDVLTRLEQVDPDFSTFSTADWAPLNQHLILRPDVKMQQGGSSTKVSDAQSVADAVEVLTTRDPDAMLVYLHDGDAVGHGSSADSPAYVAAIETLDQHVGTLLQAIESRSTYAEEDWLVVASTDHGFTGTGHGGDQHLTRKVWTLASGGDVPATGTATREWRQVDLVPTILRHLGVEIDPAWGLDGVPIGTPSTDPFDTVEPALQAAVDEPAKPVDVKGWTDQTPEGWAIDERTPEVGVTEYRGWSFMSGEFWSTSHEGQGRGSFVRGRDVVAVADHGQWDDLGDPTASGAVFDSTLYSPWQDVDPGGEVEVSFVHHYRQMTSSEEHRAEVVAEFDDGTTQVLWSRDDSQGLRFHISRPVRLTTTAPTGDVGAVRIGWRLTDGGNNGYWAVDAPEISAEATEQPEPGASPELTVDVTPRCLAGTAYLAVRATNADDVAARVTITTPVGTREFADVAPGRSAYQAFATRSTSVAAGTVTVEGAATVDGEDVAALHEVEHPGLTC